jgi:predicted phage-related endonuclease
MLATLDGVVQGSFGEAGLEIKTASVFEKKEWIGDNIPDSYYAQVQHYMVVTGLRQFFVLALVGAELFLKRIQYNESFARILIEKEKEFWEEYVLKNQIPAPIGLPNEDDCIERLFPSSIEETISVPDLEEKAEEYIKINEQIKDLEEIKRRIVQEIKMKIGNAKVCFAGNHKITWIRYQQTRIDTDRLKAEAPDIYERFSKTIETSRLMIK